MWHQIIGGIDLNKTRNRLVDAVVALSTKPNGFTVAQLATAAQMLSGQDVNIRLVTRPYDLTKLIGEKLVHRVERSRRYAVDPSGLWTLCACVLLRDKIITPLLAGVTPLVANRPKSPLPWISNTSSSAKSFTTPETIGCVTA
jgi:hypothetical protein